MIRRKGDSIRRMGWRVSYQVTMPDGTTWVDCLKGLEGADQAAAVRVGRRAIKGMFPTAVVRFRTCWVCPVAWSQPRHQA